MIKINSLVKNYYNSGIETKVLKNISLEISKSQFVSIIGPSGAGKSTLLYQVSLLDKPTSGEIFIDKALISNLSQKEASNFRLKNFGFIFQDYALIPELTSIENIIIPSIMLGLDLKEAKKEAEKNLKLLDVLHTKDKLPNQLSGGEQQRVSIARAISRNPKILFADEPTASLDTEHSQEVLDTLIELKNNGQTIVMVTHEEEFAKQSDRIIKIKDGEIISDRIIKK